jgi:hypothetical protein
MEVGTSLERTNAARTQVMMIRNTFFAGPAAIRSPIAYTITVGTAKKNSHFQIVIVGCVKNSTPFLI